MHPDHAEHVTAPPIPTPQGRQEPAPFLPGRRTRPSASPGTAHRSRGGPGLVGEQRLFIGREREMESLQAFFARMMAGSGQLVLIHGEPGIGKTSLLDAFARVAHQHQARLLWGRCWEGDGAPAFWPWVQIVRACIHDNAADPDGMARWACLTDLAWIVPEVRGHLPQLPAPPPQDPETARFRVFDGLTGFFKHAARQRPLVLLLDDLHRADASSLRLLHFLTRDLHGARLLVLGAYRTDHVRRGSPLSAALGELARQARCLELRGLTEADIAQMLTQMHGTTPAASLVEALHQHTAGNPFFVRAMLDWLAAAGEHTDAEGAAPFPRAVPQSVRETVLQRLTGLSDGCLRLLSVAAVLGREFTLDLVLRISDPAPGGGRHDGLAVVDEALAARVIQEVPQRTGRYRFAHALLRETLYEDLPLTERLHWHQHVGEVLERLHARRLEPHLAELADHFSKAALRGTGGKALHYSLRAGQHAMELLACEEAVAHYERALQLLELQEPDHARHGTLLLALGEALWGAGDNARACAVYGQAAQAAQAAGDAAMLAQAALGFGVARDETGEVDATLVRLLEAADTALGPDPSSLRVRVLARLAEALYFSAETERRHTLSSQALALARQVGDPQARACALSARHFILWGPGTAAERLALSAEMVQLAEVTGDATVLCHGLIWQITDLAELGDMAAADRALARYAQQGAVTRLPRWRWELLLMRAARALFDGRFDEAERLAAAALAAHEAGASTNATQFFTVQMFTLRREQGRLAELAPAVMDFVTQCTPPPGWRCALALLHAELGQREAARHEFDRLAAQEFVDLPRDSNWLPALALLAEACCALGDVPRAATLYALLQPYAAANVVIGNAAACYGSVARYLGLLATLLARWPEAEAHFEAALHANRRMGARPFVAHTQHDYARMLLERGRPEDRQRALALLEAAHEAAEALGMRRLLDHIAALRERVAGEKESTADARPTGPSENVFRKADKSWSLSFDGSTIVHKHSKGLAYIATLLQSPGREVHVVDLAGHTAGWLRPSGAAVRRSQAQHEGQHLQVARPTGGPPVADAAARAAYRQRLAEVEQEMEEAEHANDPARAARAQAERDSLVEELARAYSLGSRLRRADEATERVRKTVTNCIRFALTKIQTAHPALWRHLATSLRTGTFCSYRPEQSTPWQF